MSTPPSASSSSSRELVRGTVIVSVITQLSRVLGFVREALTARLIGDGFIADAYFVASRIPNLLRSIFAEGALTSAFVPLFAHLLEKERTEAIEAFQRILGFLIIATLGVSLLGITYAETIVHFFAPGFSPEKVAYCAELTRIMFPFITIMSTVSLMNGVLNAHKVFGASAWAQVIINIALIIGACCAYFAPTQLAGHILSWSVIIGGLCGVAAQLPALKKIGITLRPRCNLLHRQILTLLSLMAPAILGAALYQLSIFISGVLASLLPEGAVSALYYGDRIAQLPIGIFTVALGSVLLPALSRSAARGDLVELNTSLTDALRYTTFIIIPIAGALYLFALPLVVLFLEGGKFSRSSSIAAAIALQGYAIGLWAVSCHSLTIKAFLARKDTITPSLLSLCSLMVGITISLTLMGPPSAAHDDTLTRAVTYAQTALSTIITPYDLGHVGLALSSSLAALAAFILLGLFLTIRFTFTGWRTVLITTFQSVSALAVALYGTQLIFSSYFNEQFVGDIRGALILLCAGISFIALYLVISLLLRSNECVTILSALRKRIQTITTKVTKR
jgi:putative peptidoglycan lipid II flippase